MELILSILVLLLIAADVVAIQTASKWARTQASVAADSRGMGRVAAYFSFVTELCLRPSERCLTASASRLLLRRLQTRVELRRHRLLTVGFGACGGVLERGEGPVLGETL